MCSEYELHIVISRITLDFTAGPVLVDGVDVSIRCNINNSIVSLILASSGLLFPSLTLNIPVRTFEFEKFCLFKKECTLVHLSQ